MTLACKGKIIKVLKHKPGTFEYIEAKIRADAKWREYGFDFERLCKFYLETAPLFKNNLKKVWLWKEWPDRWKQQEHGIDLVAITHDGDYWAIQAKCFDPTRQLIKEEIDSFISESARRKFSYRLLIATTNKTNWIARDILDAVGELAQVVPVGTHLRDEILKAEITWPTNINKKIAPHKPYKVWSHHKTAIKDVIANFKKSSKGQLIMACGTGKTFTSIKIAERINAKRILVLVPSLNLIAQSIKEWGRNHKKPFSMCVVCSDETVMRGQDTTIETTGELGIPVTTNPRKIKHFLKKREIKPKIIFCTYQSLDQIEKIQKKDCPTFDLVIADEAHRCAGLSDGGFGIVVKDNAIKSKKKLYMTATPRIIGNRVRKAAEGLGQEVISMCDKSKFGGVFHRLDFSEAIEKKILSDYQVVIIGVSGDKAKQFAVEGRIVKVGKEFKTDARTLASSIGLGKAIQKYKLQKLITFHSSVAKAKSFGDENKEGSLLSVIEKLPKNIKGNKKFWTRTIYGEMPVGKRQDFLSELRTMKNNSVGVIANCACLGEGVDVPALDGVAFIDPKRSQIDIIQAVGRVIRKSEYKKIGTVVIPVFIGDNEDPDEILKSSVFEPVWAVIKALKSHDDILSDKLDEFRINLGQKNKQIRLPSKIKLHIPAKLHLPSFQKAFSVRTVEVSTTTWDGMIKLLKEYKKKYGHFNPPKKIGKRWEGLFEWIHKIRLARRWKDLSVEKISELDDLGFDWKVSGATIGDMSGMLTEKQFSKRFGMSHPQIKHFRNEGLLKPAGLGVSSSGTGYVYRIEQVEELKKELGITLTNTKGLLPTHQFAQKFGIAYDTFQNFRSKGIIDPYGKGIGLSGVCDLYHPKQVGELRKKLGITIIKTKGLLVASELAKKAGFSIPVVQRLIKDGMIKPIGRGISKQGVRDLYHTSNIERVAKKLGVTLKNTKGLLGEQELANKVGYSSSTSIVRFRKEGLIKPVGTALTPGGVSFFYYPRQVKELRKKLGITITNTTGLLTEKQFALKAGVDGRALRKYREEKIIKPVGKGITNAGIGYFFKLSQAVALRKKLGITLKNTEGLLVESEFADKVGYASSLPISRFRKEGLIKPFGTGITSGGVSFFYHPRQVKELRKKLKITITDTTGLLTENQFALKAGVDGRALRKYREEKIIKPVGKGISKAGVGFFYHPRQIKELRKKLKNK
jgi:superfamily II DNA or RNA helicase